MFDPTSPISEESAVNIAVSLAAEQKQKERRQLNWIVHNLEESAATEGDSRKKDDIKNVYPFSRPI